MAPFMPQADGIDIREAEIGAPALEQGGCKEGGISRNCSFAQFEQGFDEDDPER